MTLDTFWQSLANGLLLGCMYGAIGLGLSLVLGILGILNVAHGSIVVLAALVYWQLVNPLGLDLLVAVPIVVIGFFGIGWLLDALVAKRVVRAPDTTGLLVFFGVMVMVAALGVIFWTTDTRNVDTGYLSGIWQVAGVRVAVSRLVVAALTVALCVAVHAFLTRTLTGTAIRAMAQRRDVAAMVGINADRLSVVVFAAGTALAAFGGVMLALVVPFSPQDHTRWLAWAFVVVIVGGLGNVAYTLLAGLVLGLFEAFFSVLLPFQYVYLIVYGLLVLALLVKKEGLHATTRRAI